jgi:hypothetical protein
LVLNYGFLIVSIFNKQKSQLQTTTSAETCTETRIDTEDSKIGVKDKINLSFLFCGKVMRAFGGSNRLKNSSKRLFLGLMRKIYDFSRARVVFKPKAQKSDETFINLAIR